MNRYTYNHTVKCELSLTANARKGMEKISLDEHAFFSSQKSFIVHIEKRPENHQGNQLFSFFFDNEENERLTDKLEGRVAVLDCVVKHDGFVVTGFHLRGRRYPVSTNRRLRADMKFLVGKSTGVTLPIEFATLLRELPIAEERSKYVEKRISGWEGYLQVMEKSADVEDITTKVIASKISEDGRRLSIQVSDLPSIYWKKITGFSAKFEMAGLEIGNVLSINKKEKAIEILLTSSAAQTAKKNQFQGTQYDAVTFTNFAELSQVRRLRKGFKDLQDGLAANSNLEKILFEERPVVKITNRREPFDYDTELNEFQQEAVSGAMNAHDLFVIQGPPGTGKTTVISEICNQAVKAGMRTLVASQANLAVDNAIGRLLHNPDIRILRYGRTESIEEEGKKFIEENVAEQWRLQTAKSIEDSLERQTEFTTILQNDLKEAESRQIELESERKTLVNEQAVWKERENEAKSLLESITSKKRELHNVSLEYDKLLLVKQSTEKEYVKIEKEIDELAKALNLTMTEDARSLSELLEEKQNLIKQIEFLQTAQSYEKLLDQQMKLQEQADFLGEQLHRISLHERDITLAKRLNDIQDILDNIEYKHSTSIDQMMIQLIRQIDQLGDEVGEESVLAWKNVLTRVTRAIETVTEILTTHHFHNRIVIPTGFRNRHALESVQETISRVGRYLVQPDVKKIITSTSFSVEAYDCLENLTKAVSLLHDRKNFIVALLAEVEATDRLFLQIKTAIQTDLSKQKEKFMIEQSDLLKQITLNERQIENVRSVSEKNNSDESFQEMLSKVKGEYEELIREIKQREKEEFSLEATKNTLRLAESKKTELLLNQQTIHEKEACLAVDKSNLERTIEENEKSLVVLNSLLAMNPSSRLEEVAKEQLLTKETISRIEKRLSHVPILQSLQKTWHTMLEEASEYDLDEIRKLYIKHANVIGTTCVASARKEFADDYPVFDLVIIDEVSKATPPELLLPMLKGKKIILVGDHHQLPPLIGQETMEEFLEELSDQTEKKEMELLLKESLFERLFRTLPKQNKTMLGKQYRMHTNIMETITPFYNENGYELVCGLPNSDEARDHHLQTELISRDNHIVWIDQPNTPSFYETKPKGGTSRYNMRELESIQVLIQDIEHGTAEAVKQGILPLGTKKEVGVISFYGEQVKRIDRMLQEDIHSEFLTFRTGTVDKFQGMEMDIIIVSFVRNHGDSSGDIGFAKDYRRLNVALSRAKQLLVIVGSSEMFMSKPKAENVRKMYEQLYNTVNKQQGIRSFAEPVKG